MSDADIEEQRFQNIKTNEELSIHHAKRFNEIVIKRVTKKKKNWKLNLKTQPEAYSITLALIALTSLAFSYIILKFSCPYLVTFMLAISNYEIKMTESDTVNTSIPRH